MAPKRPARAGEPRSAGTSAAILVCAIALSWIASFPGAGQRPTRVWRGYHTLLLSPRMVRSGGLAAVVKVLGPGVVSELTATVAFWSFTGLERVPLAGLNARIDPRDPRHDRFMNGVEAYFRLPGGREGAWSVAYIPARRAPAVDFLRLAGTLGFPRAGAWRLVEFDPLGAGVAVGALLGFALLMTFPRRRESPLRLAASAACAAAWVPFLLAAGPERLALCLLLFASWYRAAEALIALRGWDGKVLRETRGFLALFLADAGAALVVLIPGGGFASGALIELCGPLAGSSLLVVALARYRGPTASRRRRGRFEPVPIVRPLLPADPPRPTALLLGLAALLAMTLLTLLRSLPVPTPLAVLGAPDFSWPSIARLSRLSRPASLPDVSDLVAHEAYQETLAFGRPWGLPARGERVYLREFLMGPGGGPIVAVRRKVKEFDSVWLASSLSDPGPGSLEGLLRAQERPVAVGLRSAARPLARELPVVAIVMLLLSVRLARPRVERWSADRAPLMRSLLLRLNVGARHNRIS